MGSFISKNIMFTIETQRS